MATENAPQITTGEERVKEREKAYEAQKGLETDLAAQRKLQKQQMLRQVAADTLKNLGSPSGLIKAQQQGMTTASQMPVTQQQAKGQQALQTATMGADIASAKSEQKMKQYMAAKQEGISRLGLETARRAFDLGISAKELALHQNSEVADLAFQQMYSDYQAGRMTQKELSSYARTLKAEAESMQRNAEIMLREAMAEFNGYIAEGNFNKGRQRIMEALERQKEAMKAAARASNAGAMLSGVFTIGGAILGGFMGGPAGAAVGAKVGSGVAPLVSNSMQ